MNIIDLLIKYCLPSENFSYKQYDESFLKSNDYLQHNASNATFTKCVWIDLN